MHKTRTALLALSITALVSACATAPRAERVAQRKADYIAVAGPDQHSFRYYNPLWSWEPLNRDLLVVYARPAQAWLLTLAGCLDLEYANAIGMTSRMGEVSVGFDKVLTGRNDLPCTITRIQPVDVAHLKARQAERRSIESKPRAAETPGGTAKGSGS